MKFIPLLFMVLLVGCAGVGKKTPPPEVISVPQLHVVEKHVYVRIPASLLEEEPVVEGDLAECPDVARHRRATIERLNAKLREIAHIHGTVVPTLNKEP